MKTLASLIFCTLSIPLLFAQTSEPVEVINKGTRFIGGSFSFTSVNRRDEYRSTDISIGPGMGFYIKDDLAVGGFLSYTFGKSEFSPTNASSEINGIGLNVFLLKNYKIVNNLFFTLQPQLSLYRSKEEFSNPFSYSFSNFNFGMGVSPGILFFVSKKFALQTSIGNLNYSYNRRKSENSGEYTSTHSFGLNGAFSTSSFSIRYFLW